MSLRYSFFDQMFHPIVGAVGAGCSTIVIAVAEALPSVPQGWVELGGTLGLIGFLSYGCITLWKELQLAKKEARDDRDKHYKTVADLNLEIREEKRDQNERLITAISKLDPN